MDKQFIGCTVTVDCGEYGTYQGEVNSFNNETLILKKPFKNGVPHTQAFATIRSNIIEDLKILKTAEEASQPCKMTASTVTVKKPVAKRINRSVSENIVGNKLLHSAVNINANNMTANNNSSYHNNYNNNLNNSSYNHNNSNANNQSILLPHSSSMQILGESPWKSYSNENRLSSTSQAVNEIHTPNKKDRLKQKWTKSTKNERDEACFGEPINDILSKDFDFEKNLALFNKKAVYDEINAQRPDLVRQTDKQVNYRHDESVLGNLPAQNRQITVPPHYTQRDYVTDDGQIVPTIPSELRRLLLNLAEDYGFTFERQSEMIGRAATEIGIQLLGGARRFDLQSLQQDKTTKKANLIILRNQDVPYFKIYLLQPEKDGSIETHKFVYYEKAAKKKLNPQNSHQKPLVVVMCGSNRPGAIGLSTARQFAAHGVTVLVYLMDLVHVTTQVSQELSLYKLTGQKFTTNIQELPNAAVDLIVLALADERTNQLNGLAASWILDSRAPILAVDPPASGTPGIAVKLSIVPSLPLAHCQANGQIYLVNLAIPQKVYTEIGIAYKSPFGSKFVIPLHPSE